MFLCFFIFNCVTHKIIKTAEDKPSEKISLTIFLHKHYAYFGKIYKAQNEPQKAREMFGQAVESAKSSPDYRRRELRF
ncbi:hypothetical protein BH20ACI1_BH20ACI1_23840 [soil metagenome]